MGDVTPDVNSVPGTGGGGSSASEPSVSNRSPDGTLSVESSARPTNVTHFPNSTAVTNFGRYGPLTSLNMSNMSYALPDNQPQPSPFESHQMMSQYSSPTHPSGVLQYPMQSMSHYNGQPSGGSVPFGMPFTPNYSPLSLSQQSQHVGGPYPPYVANASVGPGHAPVYGAGYYHPPSFATTYGGARHPSAGQLRSGVYPGRPGFRASGNSQSPHRGEHNRVVEAEYDVSKTIVDGSNPMRFAQPSLASDAVPLASSTPTIPSTPRGPPRKPKQSGHALWVGNLPPGASVTDLRDHFSQDASHQIESVFLISKSNCAFVNYKLAAACAAALTRFHDSRFQGVRLVCRLRKGFTAPGSGLGAPSFRAQSRPEETPLSVDKPTPTETRPAVPREQATRSLDRYFIVKSLTVEDLELSKQSGIWATQAHNEMNLNQAFETTGHVYLIFSANKSGEYFGYARMLSPISDDEELAMQMPARSEPVSGAFDEMAVTNTAATSTAPKGRIIDDPARGTIFWEVESSEDDDEVRSEHNTEGPGDEVEGEGQSFGKPFRIQWVSTERLPFHRTRGLRNPWNANREVKIARDGTEIEPTIGRKLIQLFHLDGRAQ